MISLWKDKTRIVCIVAEKGEAERLADELVDIHRSKKNKHSLTKITMYTTRKMVTGETQGKEYTFLSDMPKYKNGEVMTLTNDGTVKYWTLRNQFRFYDCNVLVADENIVTQLLSYQHDTSNENDWKFEVAVIRPDKDTNAKDIYKIIIR